MSHLTTLEDIGILPKSIEHDGENIYVQYLDYF